MAGPQKQRCCAGWIQNIRRLYSFKQGSLHVHSKHPTTKSITKLAKQVPSLPGGMSSFHRGLLTSMFAGGRVMIDSAQADIAAPVQACSPSLQANGRSDCLLAHRVHSLTFYWNPPVHWGFLNIVVSKNDWFPCLFEYQRKGRQQTCRNTQLQLRGNPATGTLTKFRGRV